MADQFHALELCAGGGGQALGLEMAGFAHAAAVEYEPQFCQTLRFNRPSWSVLNLDIRDLDGRDYTGLDLVAGGVPCPPFSVAGKQLGSDDERDMFPAALRIIKAARPRAVLLENVPGLATSKFESYRNGILADLAKLGYDPDFRILQASDFGVPQLRPRFVLVALRSDDAPFFTWPSNNGNKPPTVGKTLKKLMASAGWKGATAWAENANEIAPTVVGGSKKHGGPDLGPTRAKQKWKSLGVDGMGIANAPPDANFPFDEHPKLTVEMVARIQGFPPNWKFQGKKTIAYRQVGNAFPPPVAKAVGEAIVNAFRHNAKSDVSFNQARLLEEPSPYKIHGSKKRLESTHP